MKIYLLLLIMSLSVVAHDFTVMTYNAQNLFDTTHDIGKNDYTYLPLKFKQQSAEVQAYCDSLSNDYYRQDCLTFDWNEDVLEKKLNNLRKSILAFNNGMGADVIALQEVENINVLKMLQVKLAASGYHYISLIEGPDSRGIDVGFISKYKIESEKLHHVDMDGIAKKTRGILEIKVTVHGKDIILFNNHWPSQNNSDEARLVAAQTLAKVSQEVKADSVIALGDFNTLSDDAPHGINLELKPIFNLSRDMAIEENINVFAGSHWYAGHWSALDRILVLKNVRNRRITPKYDHYKIQNLSFLLGDLTWTDWETGEETDYQNVPQSFSSETGKGYSDHLPVTMLFKVGK